MIWTLPIFSNLCKPLSHYIADTLFSFLCCAVELDCEISEDLENEIQYWRQIGANSHTRPMIRAEEDEVKGEE